MSGPYLDIILDAIASGRVKIDGMVSVAVQHDDWCSSYGGEACDCKPNVFVEMKDGSRRQLAKDGQFVHFTQS